MALDFAKDHFDLWDEDDLSKIRDIAPAVLADKASNKMSDNYNYMSSLNIGRHLQDQGLQLRKVSQQFSRGRDPRYQEHTLRFTLPNLVRAWAVNDSVPELVVVNSHNGYRSMRAYAGIFRMVCTNGLVVSEMNLGFTKARHIGRNNTEEMVIKSVDKMSDNLSFISRRVEAMEELMLTKHEQNMLAAKMIKARKAPAWLEPKMILEARREEDKPDGEEGQRSLWKTFNVLQEKLTKEVSADELGNRRADGRGRGMVAIRGAMADINTNAKLWSSLEDFIGEHDYPSIPKKVDMSAEEAELV